MNKGREKKNNKIKNKWAKAFFFFRCKIKRNFQRKRPFWEVNCVCNVSIKHKSFKKIPIVNLIVF